MKRYLATILLISSLLSLTNCSVEEYISFQEYTEIVKSASENQRDIFVFSSSKCAHCKKIQPLLDKYIASITDENLHIYQLSVDYKAVSNDQYAFKDKTMGYLTGNSIDDCIKRLDSRIALYVTATAYIPSSTGLITTVASTRYSYCATPLILWYEGGLEVKISNNVTKNLQVDENDKIIYDSFVEFMEYPTTSKKWNIPFNLTYYTEQKSN